MAERAVRLVRAELSELLDEYLEHVKATTSPATRNQYTFVLHRVFGDWAAQEGIGQLSEIDRAALDRFSRHLQAKAGARGKPLSAYSVRTYIRVVNLWLAWVARNAGGDKELRADAPKPRRQTFVTLTRDDIDKMERAAQHPRNKLIIRLLADTGIRVGELVNLRLCDVIREPGHCYLHIRGKTGGRVVGIEPSLHRRIRAYVDGGRQTRGEEDEPLFTAVRMHGGQVEPLQAGGVLQMVKYAGEAADIRKRITAHLFRHSYATEFLNRGGDAVMLAKVLGHGSLAMIQSVYAHLAADQVADAMLRHLQAARRK